MPGKGAVLTSMGWGTRDNDGKGDLEFPFWPTFILISVTMSPGSSLLLRAMVPSPTRLRGGGRETRNGGKILTVVVVVGVVVVVDVLIVVVGLTLVVLGWPHVRSEIWTILLHK